MLGILNSRAISFWFEHKFGKLQRGLFPQFKINELAAFPIPEVSLTQEALLARLVSKQLNRSDNSIERGENQLDGQIDFLVYHLYGLTYDEVLIVDPETTISREEYEAYNIEQ